mgnify:CR=1 FL=1|tara:strand:+ start:8746 stop:9660 length:915 start_codon:yes stop_codon:yes gene_type:complete
MKKFFLINHDSENSRLDRWFKINICNVPQSLIEKNIRKGNIKINYRRKKSSYKLKKGDKVILFNINFEQRSNKKKLFYYKASKKDLSSSKSMFIENNENFAIINKPAGISVQAGTKSRRNIVDILRHTKEFSDTKPFVVHRIDKETTGILVIAKNRNYAQLFTSLFRIRRMHKTYLGIVIGNFEKNTGTYTDYLYHYEGDRKVKSKAVTHYKVLDSNNHYSLLRLNPITGRKHQLRKQLLMHGHPILGDQKYRLIDKNFNKKDFLMLHAFKIDFSINNHKYNFTADLPEIFKKNLNEKYLKISL